MEAVLRRPVAGFGSFGATPPTGAGPERSQLGLVLDCGFGWQRSESVELSRLASNGWQEMSTSFDVLFVFV